MLERLGHTVTVASHGGEAVKAVQTQPFDVVMMDVQMPEMDGLEATKCIRAWEAGQSRIPIIALTAHAMASQRDECLAAGMDSFLSKPVLFEALKLELERIQSKNAESIKLVS